MIFDAIVLAGGRASRLDGVSKAQLVVGGQSLLSRSLNAAAGARRVVVVGEPLAVPAGVLVTREDPAFGGPAAAIGAGLAALATGPVADFVLVLACDVPNSAAAVVELIARAAEGRDGVLAIDAGGNRQPLLGLYRCAALADAVRAQGPGIRNLSVRALLAPLGLAEIMVAAGSTDDIDTWSDAAEFGISRPSPTEPGPVLPTKGPSMSDRDDAATLAALTDWSERLTTALGIEGAPVDIEAVLALAGTAAHAIMRPAAPLTTYLVGYAAGLAAGSESGTGGFERAAGVATGLAASTAAAGPDTR